MILTNDCGSPKQQVFPQIGRNFKLPKQMNKQPINMYPPAGHKDLELTNEDKFFPASSQEPSDYQPQNSQPQAPQFEDS
jgi:hypothetical protein